MREEHDKLDREKNWIALHNVKSKDGRKMDAARFSLESFEFAEDDIEQDFDEYTDSRISTGAYLIEYVEPIEEVSQDDFDYLPEKELQIIDRLWDTGDSEDFIDELVPLMAEDRAHDNELFTALIKDAGDRYNCSWETFKEKFKQACELMGKGADEISYKLKVIRNFAKRQPCAGTKSFSSDKHKGLTSEIVGTYFFFSLQKQLDDSS